MDAKEHPATLDTLADKLHGMGDTAYCTAIDMSKKDLCLGEEHKIKTGSFSLENLRALEAVRAKFGEANGLWAAAKIVRASVVSETPAKLAEIVDNAEVIGNVMQALIDLDATYDGNRVTFTFLSTNDAMSHIYKARGIVEDRLARIRAARDHFASVGKPITPVSAMGNSEKALRELLLTHADYDDGEGNKDASVLRGRLACIRDILRGQ